MSKINSVRNFWQNNPLFYGESKHCLGSKEYFDEHRDVYMKDCFANKNIFRKMLPDKIKNKALDAGCGIGFWTIECLQTENINNMYSCDLTEKAVELTKNRLNIYNLQSNVVVENLENLTFESNYFDFIICSGVIHHTPDTKKSVND